MNIEHIYACVRGDQQGLNLLRHPGMSNFPPFALVSNNDLKVSDLREHCRLIAKERSCTTQLLRFGGRHLLQSYDGNHPPAKRPPDPILPEGTQIIVCSFIDQHGSEQLGGMFEDGCWLPLLMRPEWKLLVTAQNTLLALAIDLKVAANLLAFTERTVLDEFNPQHQQQHSE